MRVLYCANRGGSHQRGPRRSCLLESPGDDMPFDILMLLHFQETWNRSTGAHASALLEEGVLILYTGTGQRRVEGGFLTISTHKETSYFSQIRILSALVIANYGNPSHRFPLIRA